MFRIKGINGRKGQAVVETALVLPIIVLILCGIIDFGLMFNNYLVLTNASREGARKAALGSTDTIIQQTILNLSSSLDQSKITITIYPAASLRKTGDETSVTVDYNNSLFTPIISAIIPNPMHLRSKTVMRIE